MNTIKIINPAAGKGKAVKEIKSGEKFYVSKSVGDVEKYVCKTLKNEPETHFIICGGDGTLNEAVNGIIKTGAQDTAVLSVIGTGTGNDFIKCENRSNDIVKCDVIQYNSRYFINILNIGFDCTVVSKTDELKKKPLLSGSFAYVCGVVNTLAKDFGERLNVTLKLADGTVKTIEDDLMICVAANSQYYGGGFMTAPLADVTDGLIDFVAIKKLPRRKIPTIIGLYKKGKHLDNNGNITEKFKGITYYEKCTELSIKGMKRLCADGEIEDCESVKINIIPKAVNFLF